MIQSKFQTYDFLGAEEVPLLFICLEKSIFYLGEGYL